MKNDSKVRKLRSDAVSEDMAKDRIYKTHNGKIVILKFNGANKKSHFKCSVCDNKWDAITSSVWRGSGCPVCGQELLSFKLRHGLDFLREYIESQKCELLSSEYKNTKTKLTIRFACGHIGKICFDSFKRGSRCVLCGHKNAGVASRICEEVILQTMSENNFIYTGFPEGYKDRESYITYTCQYGHENHKKFKMFLKRQTCTECTKIKQQIGQTGSKGANWQGGLVLIRKMMNNKIKDWKKESVKACNYKCVFTGERFNDIHHLQSMNLIIKESIAELGFEIHEYSGSYTDDEMFQIINKVREIHDRYPLGVCLKRKFHTEFHRRYGYGDTTPDQFYEFQQRIQSGEIQIN